MSLSLDWLLRSQLDKQTIPTTIVHMQPSGQINSIDEHSLRTLSAQHLLFSGGKLKFQNWCA